MFHHYRRIFIIVFTTLSGCLLFYYILLYSYLCVRLTTKRGVEEAMWLDVSLIETHWHSLTAICRWTWCICLRPVFWPGAKFLMGECTCTRPVTREVRMTIHILPTHRLQKSCGLCGTVLSWFTSYLTARTQYVRTLATSSRTCYPVLPSAGNSRLYCLGCRTLSIYSFLSYYAIAMLFDIKIVRIAIINCGIMPDISYSHDVGIGRSIGGPLIA